MNPSHALEKQAKQTDSFHQLSYGGIFKLALGTIVGMVSLAILLLIVFVVWSLH